MAAFLASFTLLFVAEMGDKTQLLSMALSAKYGPYKVITAISFATVLINSIAVIAGKLLINIIPLDIISFIAAISFIIFGLWMLKENDSHDKDDIKNRFGPIITIAAAFFLAEMGDKTQLATISMAVKYRDIFSVLAGATLAMIAANIIGVTVGAAIRRYISIKHIRWFSAIIFVVFGLISVYNILLERGAIK